jgi:hypothetical protein
VTKEWEGDRHHFRLILSPENGYDIADMRAYVRDVMQRVERDVGTKLDWIGIEHHNTDNPHAHILFRGKDEQGQDLILRREYIGYPLTIRLDDELMKIVKVQATLTRSSLGSVVVDAARQALMPEYQQKQEQVLLKAMDRCFNRLVKMHEDQQAQHELVREMLGMFVRTFFRHTPVVKAELREAATASAARRFESFLDRLATNRRNRRSVMDPAPAQEASQPSSQAASPSTPSDRPATLFDRT